MLRKNDPLPDTYRNFPYQYLKGSLGTMLRKNMDELYLYGDDETKFFQDFATEQNNITVVYRT